MDSSLGLKFDLYDESLLAITLFFDAISDRDFLRYASYLLQGISLGLDYKHCEFYDPDEIDEEPFDGVRFRLSMTDEEITVTFDTFLGYLRMAANSYLQRHPEDESKVIALLQKHNITLRPKQKSTPIFRRTFLCAYPAYFSSSFFNSGSAARISSMRIALSVLRS